MKVGIFGGSFDPPHKGHMQAAAGSRKEFGLDRLILLPTGVPPHKNSITATAEQRFEMCRIVAEKYKFEISDYEVFSRAYCYSADALEHFAEVYKNDELFFVVGGDSINYIDKWHTPERIFKVCTLIVAAREEIDKELIARLRAEYGAKICFMHNRIIDISSTRIRDNIKNKISVRGMVDDEIYEYIEKNLLYR